MILQFLLLVAGFVLLVKGADWFVDGAASLAQKLGIPQLVVGLTIVAMGTSLPEAAVSIAAATKGTGGIAIGNVLGSNILNTLIILGLTAAITPLAIQKSTLRWEIPFMLAVTAVLLVFGLTGGVIARWEAGILWALFIAYGVYLFFLTKGKDAGASPAKEPPLSTGKCIVFLLLGGAMVVFGSDLTVDSASSIARYFGMSERFIGLTIIAFGTSLPELVTSVTAAKKGSADIAIGNIVGSNVFNVLFVIGTAALVCPVPYAQSFIIDALVAIASGLLLWAGAFRRRRLSRAWGLLMLAGYAGYFVYLCLA